MARNIAGKKNFLADQLSCLHQVLPTEWPLLPMVSEAICEVFGHFHVCLFATRVNFKLPLCVSPISDPMAWKHDAFQHLWDNLSVCFSTVPSSRAGSSTLVLEEWFTNFLALLVEKPFELPML